MAGGFSMQQVPRQELRQTMSLKQIQYAAILQMTALELRAYLTRLSEENPVLDVEPGEAPLDNVDIMRHVLSRPVGPAERDPDGDELPQPGESAERAQAELGEYLESQLDLCLGERELLLLRRLLCRLDDDGYLKFDEAAFLAMGYDSGEIAEAVQYLQSLDPPGAAARDLPECILLQLERLGVSGDGVRKLVEEHLEDLSLARFNKVSKSCGFSPERVRRLYQLIKTLNPRPSAGFGGSEAQFVVPDLIVECRDGQPCCAASFDAFARININRGYLKLAEGDDEARSYINKKISQAMWVARLVEGRKKTVLRIGEFLCAHQSEFFVHPQGLLKPLRMCDAAQALGVHESTVSRAAAGKYLQCSRGAFPLSHFFSSAGVGAGDARAAGVDAVLELMRQIIDAEDKARPLSDAKVAGILAGRGIKIARRTVTKYREQLGIEAALRRG
jgi:RNA polymerase sigma-54 factor